MGGRGDRSKERQPAKRLHDTQHTDNTRRSPDTGKLVATQHPPRPLEANITEASRISSHVSCGDRGDSLALLGYAFTVTMFLANKCGVYFHIQITLESQSRTCSKN